MSELDECAWECRSIMNDVNVGKWVIFPEAGMGLTSLRQFLLKTLGSGDLIATTLQRNVFIDLNNKWQFRPCIVRDDLVVYDRLSPFMDHTYIFNSAYGFHPPGLSSRTVELTNKYVGNFVEQKGFEHVVKDSDDLAYATFDARFKHAIEMSRNDWSFCLLVNDEKRINIDCFSFENIEDALMFKMVL